MAEPKVIEGWRCERRGGSRVAVSDHGTVAFSATGKLVSCGDFAIQSISPAVLAWLVKPLLHEAWEAGRTSTPRNANQNPYEDE